MTSRDNDLTADAATAPSAAAFTPGPWEAVDDLSVQQRAGGVICQAFYVSMALPIEQAVANTKLIATAPELLTFAVWFDADMGNTWPNGPNGHPATLDDETAQAWRHCRALIAKATGAA